MHDLPVTCEGFDELRVGGYNRLDSVRIEPDQVGKLVEDNWSAPGLITNQFYIMLTFHIQGSG